MEIRTWRHKVETDCIFYKSVCILLLRQGLTNFARLAWSLDLPASAFCVAGIVGVYHCAWLRDS
jgi:hypothetical protein